MDGILNEWEMVILRDERMGEDWMRIVGRVLIGWMVHKFDTIVYRAITVDCMHIFIPCLITILKNLWIMMIDFPQEDELLIIWTHVYQNIQTILLIVSLDYNNQSKYIIMPRHQGPIERLIDPFSIPAKLKK